MRPRRGTELHGRGVFLGSVVIGTICVVANTVRLITEPGAVGVIATIGLVIVGAYGVWRGGYMLEWWGPAEPR